MALVLELGRRAAPQLLRSPAPPGRIFPWWPPPWRCSVGGGETRWTRREASDVAREPTTSPMQEEMQKLCWSPSCFARGDPSLCFAHPGCRCRSLLETVLCQIFLGMSTCYLGVAWSYAKLGFAPNKIQVLIACLLPEFRDLPILI
jgi:hypothetical protein